MKETANNQVVNSAADYEQYLTELFVASVSNVNSASRTQDNLYSITQKWGRSEEEADIDIRRVENLEYSVRLFISKAVYENWNK